MKLCARQRLLLTFLEEIVLEQAALDAPVVQNVSPLGLQTHLYIFHTTRTTHTTRWS